MPYNDKFDPDTRKSALAAQEENSTLRPPSGACLTSPGAAASSSFGFPDEAVPQGERRNDSVSPDTKRKNTLFLLTKEDNRRQQTAPLLRLRGDNSRATKNDFYQKRDREASGGAGRGATIRTLSACSRVNASERLTTKSSDKLARPYM